VPESEQNQNKDRWIRDEKTGQPIPPMEQPGYYPGYSTLGQKAYWDAATRELVEKRVHHTPPIRFFSREELPIINAVVDRLMPQDDRVEERKIPIVNFIDERLFKEELEGYVYEDMPMDSKAYQIGLKAIEAMAQELYSTSFATIDPIRQDLILKSLHDAKPMAAHDAWKQMSVHRFWALILGDCVTAYYSHPWAWDEIGFGGPAYPRPYMRLTGGQPEPWEKPERRYEWRQPLTSISDRQDEMGGGEHPRQGGTH
jgi:hypothetical protein